MRYENKTIPLTKLLVTNRGPIEPLCNSCKTKDCSHPIETIEVAVFGVNKTFRVLQKGVYQGIVVDCEGYSQ